MEGGGGGGGGGGLSVSTRHSTGSLLLSDKRCKWINARCN